MDYHGSYRRLLGNSKAAVVGAIELYNKPNFEYRDDVFVVLLTNAWELLLKAIISRARNSIYYQKRANEPYRTVSLTDAFRRASDSADWPLAIRKEAVGRNLEFLSTFRDNTIHFYNAPGFATIVYLLAQTAITNYHDVLSAVFGQDLADKITWQLLPLGIRAPIDPIRYLAGSRLSTDRGSAAVDEFMRSLSEATAELESDGIDSSRLLTIYDVSLNAIKKIESSDIVVGVQADSLSGQILVSRRLDPNRSHPYRQTDVLRILLDMGVGITSHTFQALIWKYHLRDEPMNCWVEERTQLKKWSPELISKVRSYSHQDVEMAISDYRQHQRSQQLERRNRV